MMNKVSKIFNYCRKEHISIFSYIKNSLLYHCGQRAKRLHEQRRRKAVDEENRSNLINKNPSIIASNCNGCTIAHDLGLRFNTQFVNLWLSSRDFIKYLKNFNYYNGLKLRFIDDADYDHPVALLDDIHVYFTHYNTREEAERKWEDRKKRIDWDNVYVLATDRGGGIT